MCVKLELSEASNTIDIEESDDMSPGINNNNNNNSNNKTATILGYGNVYGSSYFLLVLNFTVAIMLTTKPLGSLSISLLIVQILSLLEILDVYQ